MDERDMMMVMQLHSPKSYIPGIRFLHLQTSVLTSHVPFQSHFVNGCSGDENVNTCSLSFVLDHSMIDNGTNLLQRLWLRIGDSYPFDLTLDPPFNLPSWPQLVQLSVTHTTCPTCLSPSPSPSTCAGPCAGSSSAVS